VTSEALRGLVSFSAKNYREEAKSAKYVERRPRALAFALSALFAPSR
jgi:hypothetical protein